jgi:hypothetical protein
VLTDRHNYACKEEPAGKLLQEEQLMPHLFLVVLLGYYAPFRLRPDEGGSRPPLTGRGGGAPAGWGAGPPPPLRAAGAWAGLSGPGPDGGRLNWACPSAQRGRLSMRRDALPHIMIYCAFIVGVGSACLHRLSHRCFQLHICHRQLLLGVLVPNIRLVYSKQFFGVLFAF